jgi:Pyridoxamine 5'-phosphate oxidase
MTMERAPEREQSLLGEGSRTTSWDEARHRLANPEPGRHNWIATVRSDGSPHLMPVLAFWIEDAFHFVAGEGTQKGRNLAADSRCVIGTTSTTLPSLDIVAEGRAEPIDDEESVRRIAAVLNANGWPLEVEGNHVHGPNAPTAGPSPYRIFRMVPTKAIGLPGTLGMDQVKQEDLPKPTRWDFAAD